MNKDGGKRGRKGGGLRDKDRKTWTMRSGWEKKKDREIVERGRGGAGCLEA